MASKLQISMSQICQFRASKSYCKSVFVVDKHRGLSPPPCCGSLCSRIGACFWGRCSLIWIATSCRALIWFPRSLICLAFDRYSTCGRAITIWAVAACGSSWLNAVFAIAWATIFGGVSCLVCSANLLSFILSSVVVLILHVSVLLNLGVFVFFIIINPTEAVDDFGLGFLVWLFLRVLLLRLPGIWEVIERLEGKRPVRIVKEPNLLNPPAEKDTCWYKNQTGANSDEGSI